MLPLQHGTNISCGKRIERSENEDEQLDSELPVSKRPSIPRSFSFLHGILPFFPLDSTPVLQNPVYTCIPHRGKPPSLLGTFILPGSAWHGKRIFLKGPVDYAAAWTQWNVSCLKTIVSGLWAVETRVLRYQDAYYIAMPDLSVDSGCEKVAWCGGHVQCVTSGVKPGASRSATEYFNSVDLDSLSDDIIKNYLTILMFRRWINLRNTDNDNNIMVRGLGGDAHASALEWYSVGETIVNDKMNSKMVYGATHSFERKVRKWMVKHAKWLRQLTCEWDIGTRSYTNFEK